MWVVSINGSLLARHIEIEVPVLARNGQSSGFQPCLVLGCGLNRGKAENTCSQ
jgi:hypothetical protein